MLPDWNKTTSSYEEIASDGEDSKLVLGETLEPEKLECENCGHKNSLQYLYCSQCSKGLVAQDTTSEQREQFANQIIESTLKEHGLFWKGLTVRGIPSVQANAERKPGTKSPERRNGERKMASLISSPSKKGGMSTNASETQ